MLKVREIAEKCSVNRNQIYRYISGNNIKPVKVVRNIRYYDDVLVEMFKEFKQLNNEHNKDTTDLCLKNKHLNEQFLNSKIELLEKENSFLKRQIEEQNSQIKELHTLLHESNQKLLSNDKHKIEQNIKQDKQRDTSDIGEKNSLKTVYKQSDKHIKEKGLFRGFLNKIRRR